MISFDARLFCYFAGRIFDMDAFDEIRVRLVFLVLEIYEHCDFVELQVEQVLGQAKLELQRSGLKLIVYLYDSLFYLQFFHDCS